MKQINKMKVLVITLLMIGLVMSLFILVNDQVNQSNNQLIAANKVKTNQNKSANSVVKDELFTYFILIKLFLLLICPIGRTNQWI